MSGVEMDGVEYNTTVYDAIKDIKFKNAVKLVNKDFMKYKTDNLYDLIIGNPPYFVCKKSDVPKEYSEFIYGRPNIFGLFT